MYFLICAVMPIISCMCKLYENNIISCMKNTCMIVSVFITMFAFCEIFYRFYCLMTYLFFMSDHNINTAIKIQEIFYFDPTSISIVISGLVITVIFISTLSGPLTYFRKFGADTCCLCIASVLLMLRNTNFFQYRPAQSLNPLTDMDGLDYGTGMAYSYYYGYLRIILPTTGMANKGLIEKICHYENSHNVTFAAKKLFILLPASSHIPPDLKEASYGWMESVYHLEDEVRMRAGVTNRKFTNNIYKIHRDARVGEVKPIYIVAEGATPLLTFYEVQRHMHHESAIYQNYKMEIIQRFYSKLNELVQNDPDCKDICELIYYDDYTFNGTRVNIAEIILQRISNLTINSTDLT